MISWSGAAWVWVLAGDEGAGGAAWRRGLANTIGLQALISSQQANQHGPQLGMAHGARGSGGLHGEEAREKKRKKVPMMSAGWLTALLVVQPEAGRRIRHHVVGDVVPAASVVNVSEAQAQHRHSTCTAQVQYTYTA